MQLRAEGSRRGLVFPGENHGILRSGVNGEAAGEKGGGKHRRAELSVRALKLRLPAEKAGSERAQPTCMRPLRRAWSSENTVGGLTLGWHARTSCPRV